MTIADDSARLVPAHPEGPDLIAYLDGELSPGQREAIRTHLESCWDCRTRLAAREERIDTFMRARQGVIPPGFPPSEPPLDAFRVRLAQHRAGTAAGAADVRGAVARLAAQLSIVLRLPRMERPAFAALGLALALLGITAWASGDLLALGAFVRESLGHLIGSQAPRPPERPPVPERPAPLPSPEARRAPSFRPLPLSYANSLATQGEVAVAVALHRAGACLGEEINVFQMSDGSLLVQGLVDTKSRSEQITRALADLPQRAGIEVYSSTELQTAAELYDPPGRPASSPLPPGRPSARLLDLGGLEMPMYGSLHRHFADEAGAAGSPGDDRQIQQLVARFASEVVGLSRQALFQAWALRNLEIEFSTKRTKSLPRTSMAAIQALRAEHRRGLSETAQKLLRRLSDVGLTAGLPTGDAVAPQENTRGRTPGISLLRLATEQDAAVRALFTASSSAADPASDLASLLALLRQLT